VSIFFHFRSKRSQAGFGLLETLAGLVVFMILAAVGTKAFKSVIANQRETAQVKALTDAVTVTAERLSAQSVASLTAPGSAYLQWSEPEKIGFGEYWFRYRTVPNPTVSGTADTAVVGLEVEVGALAGNTFTMGRSFATLIAPHLSSKDKLGQVSTALERIAEAAFYSGHQASLKTLASTSKPENQAKLNSFNCYDKEKCCPFMDRFFTDPAMRPDDGLDEKCLYRCALGGAVTMDAWSKACGKNFCNVAPWKTKESCCAAIQSGECVAGSVCAQVCIECVGEDGTTCGPPKCEHIFFDDFVDCAKGQMCDGSAIPSGAVPGWGNIGNLCKNEACSQKGQCDWRPLTCCIEYWGVIAAGGTPAPEVEICATISRQSECCDLAVGGIDVWDKIYCNASGKAVNAHNRADGKWYCGLAGEGWDKACAHTRGCSHTYVPEGASGVGGSCGSPGITSPWKPFIIPQGGSGPANPGGGGPKISITGGGSDRAPSSRDGGSFGSEGGRE
jgi:type II secretory pathway pseudopilin PulG